MPIAPLVLYAPVWFLIDRVRAGARQAPDTTRNSFLIFGQQPNFPFPASPPLGRVESS